MRVIAAAFVVVLISAGSASAATPVEAVRQLMAGAPGQMPPDGPVRDDEGAP